MIIVMKGGATMKEVSSVLKQIEAHGFKPHMSKGEETTVIGVIGDEAFSGRAVSPEQRPSRRICGCSTCSRIRAWRAN